MHEKPISQRYPISRPPLPIQGFRSDQSENTQGSKLSSLHASYHATFTLVGESFGSGLSENALKLRKLSGPPKLWSFPSRVVR